MDFVLRESSFCSQPSSGAAWKDHCEVAISVLGWTHISQLHDSRTEGQAGWVRTIFYSIES